jgi:hypothetical protein
VGTTTCPFAENVFYEYFRKTYGVPSAATITAWSPAAARFYSVHCSGRGLIVCIAGDGAEVRFSTAAISAYGDNQAAVYAANHETGHSPGDNGIESGGSTSAPTDSSSGGGSTPAPTNCDPNYAGACLDRNSYDYDCAGGSGDGPDYTTTVRVVGDDHFGLDRDGDGIACDT